MSENFVTSDFVQELQNGDAYDDLLDFGTFDFEGLEPVLGDDHFLEDPARIEYQEEQDSADKATSEEHPQAKLSCEEGEEKADLDDLLEREDGLSSPQGAFSALETITNGHIRAGSPTHEHQSSKQPGKSIEDGDNITTRPANDSYNDGQHQDTQSIVMTQPQHSLIDDIQDQADVSSSQDIISQQVSTPSGLQQVSLPDEEHQQQDGRNNLRNSQEGKVAPKNMESTNDPFKFDHPQLGPSSGDFALQEDALNLAAPEGLESRQTVDDIPESQTVFEDEFSPGSDEWKDYVARAAHSNLAELLGDDTQEDPWILDIGDSGRPESPQNLVDAHRSLISHEPISHTNAGSPSASTHPYIYSHQNQSDREVEGRTVSNAVAFETFEEDDPSIVVAPQQKGWGRTGTRNGQEVWFNPETSEWQPSAAHHDMRATLIARAQAEYPDDRYLHPDETGGLPHGETAFFKPHQYRGPKREDCADELFAWRDYIPRKDEDGKAVRRNTARVAPDHPGYMYEGDKILLDPHDNPVVDHKFIPLTLSVHTDGAKLQEMALHPGCRQVDLWARMPRWEKKTRKSGEDELVPLRDKNSRIKMPMTRFREKKGTIAGGDREGTAQIMAGLLSFYHSQGFDPAAHGNSVKDFPRDLEPWEIKQVRLGNAARFGARAGSRALNEEERLERLQKTMKSIENGKRKQAARDGGARKRGYEDEAEDSQGPSPAPQKRLRRDQGTDAGLAAWDDRYASQQGSPSFQDAQKHGVLENPYAHGTSQGLPYGHPHAYSAPDMPFQHQNFQMHSTPMRTPVNYSQNSLGLEVPFTPVQHEQYQPPYVNSHTLVRRSPYENVSDQMPRYVSRCSNSYYSESSHLQNAAETMRNRVPGLRRPQQVPGGGYQSGPTQSDHQYMAQSEQTSNIHSQYPSSGQMNNNRFDPPSQRPFPTANSTPKLGGNTLGPGGRQVQHVPTQILGKRRQQVSEDVEIIENPNYGSQHKRRMVETIPHSSLGLPQKRQKTDGASDAQPTPQRRRQTRQHPRTQFYGAMGAPQPFAPPGNFFRSMQPSDNGNNIVERRLETPEMLSREMGGAFGGFDTDVGFGGYAAQDTSAAFMRQPEYHQPTPTGHGAQHVPGYVGRNESLEELDEYIQDSLQDQGRQNLGGYAVYGQNRAPENIYERPRMPGSGGYNMLPVQASDFPPSQLNVGQASSNSHQVPGHEVAYQASPQRYDMNAYPSYGHQVPGVAEAQGLNHPHERMRRERWTSGNEDGYLPHLQSNSNYIYPG